MGETAATNVGVLLLGTFTGIASARILGPQGRGAYAVAIAVSVISVVVASLGLQQAFAYTVASSRDDAAEALRLSFWVALLGGCAVVVIGYPLSGVLIGDGETLAAVRVGLLAVPLGVMSTSIVGVLQGLRWGRAFNAVRLAPALAFAAFLLGGIILRLDFSAQLVTAMYLAAAAVTLGAAVWLVRAKIAGLRAPARSFVRSTLRYGIVVNIGSVAWQANRYLSVLVLASFVSLSDVGYYSVGAAYALPVAVVAVALALHTLPDMADSSTSPEHQAKLARNRGRAAILGTVPLALGAIVVAPILIPIAFGPEFNASIDVARTLIIAEALVGLGHVQSEISRGLGSPGLPAVASVVGSVGAIVAIPLVAPRFGIEGAAVAMVGVNALMLSILYFGLRREDRLAA